MSRATCQPLFGIMHLQQIQQQASGQDEDTGGPHVLPRTQFQAVHRLQYKPYR